MKIRNKCIAACSRVEAVKISILRGFSVIFPALSLIFVGVFLNMAATASHSTSIWMYAFCLVVAAVGMPMSFRLHCAATRREAGLRGRVGLMEECACTKC